MSSEDLGYLLGKMESLHEKLDTHLASERLRVAQLDDRLAQIEEGLQDYRKVKFFFSTLAVIVGSVIALKWDNARQLLQLLVEG